MRWKAQSKKCVPPRYRSVIRFAVLPVVCKTKADDRVVVWLEKYWQGQRFNGRWIDIGERTPREIGS